MDTINTIANAATKAIWGETTTQPDAVKPPPNEEPISGVQGDPAKGEPFDAGNAPENSVVVDVDASSKASPSAAQPSSGTPGDSTKDQIETRGPEHEQTSPSVAAEKSDVDNVQALDPASVKGPGPKPLDQLAKEHGGDAGNTASNESPSTSGGLPTSSNPNEQQPEKKPENEGTGEKVVKCTGLEADGGDFDAANPGAGREADRLLEEKGIHQEKTPPSAKAYSPDPKPASPTGESRSPDRKGVRGLGHKIKAKLRRGSNA